MRTDFDVFGFKEYRANIRGKRNYGNTPSPYGVNIFTNTGNKKFIFSNRRALKNFIRMAMNKRNFVRYQLFWTR